MIFPVIFHPGHSFKRQKALCLTKKLFIKVSMVSCSCVVIFNLKGKFFVSAVACEMFIVKLSEDLVEKIYLRLYLTQIVHSNSKMLFL